MSRTFFGIGAILVMTSVPAGAQSFNCRYAKTPDEVAICSDPRLSQLDERMSRRFFQLRNELSPPQQLRLDETQGGWLARRNSCGSDPGCIEEVYLTRIDQLANW
jgi:uncharacterized protein